MTILMGSLTLILLLLATLGAVAGIIYAFASRRGFNRCLVPYILQTRKRRTRRHSDHIHALICIADHFEPGNEGASPEIAMDRVRRWVEMYPRLLGQFRDCDGMPPRHSFFYPIEQYNPEHLDLLSELCCAGFGEVEVHLHHDGDTAETLRATLLEAKESLSRRHGLLPRHKDSGELAYGFVHGNWALDNSRSDGRWCGVDNELDVLRETGCYADFTLPSAPSSTQTRKINSIYYARDDPHRPRSHDWGIDVGVGPAPPDALMLIQGPLVLDWRRRKWGLAPRIENGCLQSNQPPTSERLDLWLRARVQVPRRPDWYFIKLHTHGAPESNQRVLLGDPMIEFHRMLARRSQEDPRFHFHYVTAREMFNLARAAEAGWAGSISEARDYEMVWDGHSSTSTRGPSAFGEPRGRALS
ncbi:MAG: hypothetical protein P4L85_24335 [Paludisphaera borealis]|uniref:hypothetical protein n=1 Tax=Paludisphaera borealis TaxID=1387353 RepID=UPI00283B0E8F|nr:hypothetical protein [Paludisphaera borealis]MDR3622502.1 hypothetical protein [Paludisphaera borealis]